MLVLLIALGYAIAALPLGVVISQAETRVPGMTWTQVQGTVWSGRISNFGMGAQLVGDVSLKLRPESLLGGKMGYDLDVTGPVVGGTGELNINGQGVDIAVPVATANLAEFVGLSDVVRQAGGIARLTNLDVSLNRQGCQSATGMIFTDTLVSLGNRYQQSLPELSGQLGCSQSMLLLNMEGESDTGVVVTLQGSAGLTEPSRLRAVVQGAQGEMILALGALGFTEESGQFVYVRETAFDGVMP